MISTAVHPPLCVPDLDIHLLDLHTCRVRYRAAMLRPLQRRVAAEGREEWSNRRRRGEGRGATKRKRGERGVRRCGSGSAGGGGKGEVTGGGFLRGRSNCELPRSLRRLRLPKSAASRRQSDCNRSLTRARTIDSACTLTCMHSHPLHTLSAAAT